ncbi:hypothetical protein ALQ17_05274 [Pseudomonas fluorescens]|nr:hypothetical protein ALQ17_05274 [Pseudomonas fluorescens]
MADLPRQRGAQVFGQATGIGLTGAPLHHGFEQGALVADRHTFADQQAQGFGDPLQRHQAQGLLDQFAVGGLGAFQQQTGFLDAEEVGSVAAQAAFQHTAQHLVGQQETDAGVAQRVFVLALGPVGVAARERRIGLHRGEVEQLHVHRVVLHQQAVDRQLAFADRHAFQGHAETAGRGLGLHVDAWHRYVHAEFGAQLVAQRFDALAQQLARRALRHAAADSEQHAAVGQQVVIQFGLRFDHRLWRTDQHFKFRLAVMPAIHHERRAAEHQGQAEEDPGREPRQQAHADHDQRGQPQRTVAGAQLLDDLAAQVPRFAVAVDAGNHGARRHRNQQRRDLCDQAVTHGEQRVGVHRHAERHVALDHADQHAAQQVDRQDHQAGDGIALHEFHGAIHRAEHLAFALQARTPATGFGLVDIAIAQVVVDAHLLARHRVQGEARGHFRHTFGALGDHHELRHGDDQEHHHAHHHLPGDHKVAEGLDDMPGIAV